MPPDEVLCLPRSFEAYAPECVEGVSLLKNSLYARFDPRMGP